MSQPAAVTFGWYAGPSAQIEFFSPSSDLDSYRLRYSLPFRATLRPPLKELRVSAEIFADLNQRLAGVAKAPRTSRKYSSSTTPSATSPVLQEFEIVGSQLMDLVIPDDLRSELLSANLSIEVGLDERLLGIPWELLYDGSDFLCLKHAVGRFVNTSRWAPLPASRPDPFSSDRLSVLLISVPRPQARGTRRYDPLPGVEAETKSLAQILTGHEAVELVTLIGKEATYDNVYKAIRDERRFHVVHFGGHAYFRDDKPQDSSLVLFDKDMQAGPLATFFQESRPCYS
jgi:CHAT domain-containing protein